MSHIIIPLALSDRAHLGAFLKNLRQMPPAPTDRVLIVPTTEVLKYDDFKGAMEEIRSIFSVENTLIKATPNTPMGGWPAAANTHFMWAMIFMSEAEKQWGYHPVMWLETDCRFMRSGWSESLQTAYRNGGKPFMGVEVESLVTLEDKKTKVQSSQTRGTHMMGVGFYPPQYTKGRSGWKYPQKQISFTIFCQKEHANFQRTKLIAHFARTCNWTRNPDGTFACEDTPNKHPHAVLYGTKSVDLSGVVLVHGDKDGSLSNLILSGPTSNPLFVAEIKPDEALAQLDSLRRENEELKKKMASLASHPIPEMDDKGLKLFEMAQTSAGFLPSSKMISDALATGSMTLQKMAEYFECRDIPAFEAHINSLGFVAPKPARRVRSLQSTEDSAPLKKIVKKVFKKISA